MLTKFVQSQVKVLIEKAGGETNAPAGSFIGPNAMIADQGGYVLLCQHTNRQQDPAFSIERDTATGHDHVDVRVMTPTPTIP